MTRAIPIGRTVRRFTTAGLLPWLLAAGCGGQPATSTAPPGQIPPAYDANPHGTPMAPPTVRKLPPQNLAGSGIQTPAADAVTLDERYMPFAAGRSWTYKVRSNSAGKADEGTVTWKIDEAGKDNSGVTIISTMGGENHTLSNKVVKNADGTVTITSTTDGKTQTQTVKPEEMPAGSENPAQGPGGGQAKAMQGAKDKVTVAAGTFDAVKIVNKLPDGKGEIVAWYAPDVGMVKQDIQATTDQGAITSSMELQAYK